MDNNKQTMQVKLQYVQQEVQFKETEDCQVKTHRRKNDDLPALSCTPAHYMHNIRISAQKSEPLLTRGEFGDSACSTKQRPSQKKLPAAHRTKMPDIGTRHLACRKLCLAQTVCHLNSNSESATFLLNKTQSGLA